MTGHGDVISNGPVRRPEDGRAFSDLRDTGLLWLINRVVFHPRGYALGLAENAAGEATGWELLGDGSEVWTMGEGVDEDGKFAQAQQALGGPPPVAFTTFKVPRSGFRVEKISTPVLLVPDEWPDV